MPVITYKDFFTTHGLPVDTLLKSRDRWKRIQVWWLFLSTLLFLASLTVGVFFPYTSLLGLSYNTINGTLGVIVPLSAMLYILGFMITVPMINHVPKKLQEKYQSILDHDLMDLKKSMIKEFESLSSMAPDEYIRSLYYQNLVIRVNDAQYLFFDKTKPFDVSWDLPVLPQVILDCILSLKDEFKNANS